jgi:hypothetical protein
MLLREDFFLKKVSRGNVRFRPNPDIESWLRRSLWLEVGELYYLAPLRGFRCDEGTELGRQVWHSDFDRKQPHIN